MRGLGKKRRCWCEGRMRVQTVASARLTVERGLDGWWRLWRLGGGDSERSVRAGEGEGEGKKRVGSECVEMGKRRAQTDLGIDLAQRGSGRKRRAYQKRLTERAQERPGVRGGRHERQHRACVGSGWRCVRPNWVRRFGEAGMGPSPAGGPVPGTWNFGGAEGIEGLVDADDVRRRETLMRCCPVLLMTTCRIGQRNGLLWSTSNGKRAKGGLGWGAI